MLSDPSVLVGHDDMPKFSPMNPVIGVKISHLSPITRREKRVIESDSYAAINAQGSYNSALHLPKIPLEFVRPGRSQETANRSRPSRKSNAGGALTDRRPKTAQNKLNICTVGQDLQLMSISSPANTSRVPYRPLSARLRTTHTPRIPATDKKGEPVMILEPPQPCTSESTPLPPQPSAVSPESPAPEAGASSIFLGAEMVGASEGAASAQHEAGQVEPLPIAGALASDAQSSPRSPRSPATPMRHREQPARRPETIHENGPDDLDVTATDRTAAWPGSPHPHREVLDRPTPEESASVRPAGRLSDRTAISSRAATAEKVSPLVPSPPRFVRGERESFRRPGSAHATATGGSWHGAASRLVRVIGGLGDHIEREEAARALLGMIEDREISCDWLAGQAGLLQDLVSLCRCGTRGQREHSSRLLCRLSSGSAAARRGAGVVEGLGEALSSLLRAPLAPCALPAAELVWRLAEDPDGSCRVQLGALSPLVSALAGIAARFGTDDADGEIPPSSPPPPPLAREALRALRALAFQCPANCRTILGGGGSALCGELSRALVAVQRRWASDPEAALHSAALLAELTSEFDPEDGVVAEFRHGVAFAQGAIAALLRPVRDRRWGAELRMHSLITLRNLVATERCREAITVPALFEALQQLVSQVVRDRVSDSGGEVDLRKHLLVAVLDLLRVSIPRLDSAALVSDFRGLDKVIMELLQICCNEWLDRVLVFICCFTETCCTNDTVNRNEQLVLIIADIMNRNLKCVSAKYCAAILRNLAGSEKNRLNRSLLENQRLLDNLICMATDIECCGKKQALCALCNLVHDCSIAHTLSRNDCFLAYVQSSLNNYDSWSRNYTALILNNIFEHDEVVMKFRLDRALIQAFLKFGSDIRETASDLIAKRHIALALAHLTLNPQCCDTIVSEEQRTVVKLVHSLLSGENLRYKQCAAIGMWALGNLASYNSSIKICLGLIATPLASTVRILSDLDSSELDLKSGAALLKICVVNHRENSNLVSSFPDIVPALCSLAARGPIPLMKDALVVLCCITAESKSARNKRFYSSAVISAISRGLKSTDDELILASSGLICNLAESEEPLILLEEIGKRHGNFVALLRTVRTGSTDEVRSAAILALCALARADSNKLLLGKEPDLLPCVTHVFENGSTAEKANTSFLIYYMGFIFTYNSSFGQVPVVLRGLVELVDGTPDQAEKSTAAIGVLSCCAGNASVLMDELSDRLLTSMMTLLQLKTEANVVNAFVCLWNLSKSSDIAKTKIGEQTGIFPLLVHWINVGKGDIIWHAAGLLSELLKDNRRNAVLFSKTSGSIDTILEKAMAATEGKVMLCFCAVIVNFALSSDESHVKMISEKIDGLVPVTVLTRLGSQNDQERALQLLAHPFFHSLPGRQRLGEIPGLVSQLMVSVVNGTVKEKEYSAAILHNLSISTCTRSMILMQANAVEWIQNAISIPRAPTTPMLRVLRSLFGCFSNLALDIDFCCEIMKSSSTLESVFKTIFAGEDLTLEFALACVHNILSSVPELRNTLLGNDALIQKFIQLMGVKDDKQTAFHATGIVNQLSKPGPKCLPVAEKLLSNPLLIPNLLISIKFGSEMLKELGCATLAILGENDDDVSSMSDDMFNMMIAMAEGALDILTSLFMRGTPAQCMYATVVLSNMLVSTGAFIKAQLAELKGFFPILIRFIQSLDDFHSTFSLRLLFHLVRNDSFIIDRACHEVPIMKVLFDRSESCFTSAQEKYLCLCLAELTLHYGEQVCEYRSGKIFEVITFLLSKKNESLFKPVVLLLRNLVVCRECRSHGCKISKHIDDIISFPAALEPLNQDLITDILTIVTTFSVDEDNVDLLQLNMLTRYLANAMKSDNQKIRQNATESIFNLCSNPKINASIVFADLEHVLFQGVLSGEQNELEIEAVCKNLSIILNLQSPETPLNLDAFLSFCFATLNQDMQAGNQMLKRYILSCLKGLSTNVECCKRLAKDAIAFQTILLYGYNSKSLNCAEYSDLVIAILCNALENDIGCVTTLAAYPQFFDTLVRSLTGSINAASLALRCARVLRKASSDYCSNLRKTEDFWLILLLFLDDRNIVLAQNDRILYDASLAEVIDLIHLFASLDGNYRGITIQRHAAAVIARLFFHAERNIRREGLMLAYKCCLEDLHFSKMLGSESTFITMLTDLISLPGLCSEILDPSDQILVLKVLTLISRVEQHCLKIGHTKGFLLSLLQTVKLRHSAQHDSKEVFFQRAASSDSSRLGAGVAAVQDLYEIQASLSLRHFCSKRPTAEFVLRLPFPVLETLLAGVLSTTEADREDAIEVLICMASASEQALMIMGLHGESIFRSLAAIVRGYPKQRTRVLKLISILAVTQSLGRSLVDSPEIIGSLSTLIAAEDATFASAGALIIESVARVDRSHAMALGQMPALTDALVRCSLRIHTGAGIELCRAAAASAEAAILELSKNNGVNTSLFRRLKDKYSSQ